MVKCVGVKNGPVLYIDYSDLMLFFEQEYDYITLFRPGSKGHIFDACEIDAVIELFQKAKEIISAETVQPATTEGIAG